MKENTVTVKGTVERLYGRQESRKGDFQLFDVWSREFSALVKGKPKSNCCRAKIFWKISID